MGDTTNGRPITIYTEKYLWGRRTISLYDDRISIYFTQVGGNNYEWHLLAAEISPYFGKCRFRWQRWWGGFVICLFFLGVVWLFTSPFEMPFTSARVIVALLFSAAGFVLGLYGLRHYTAYRFQSRSGVNVLDLLEIGPDRARCQQFAEQIALVARRTQQPQSNAEIADS